MIYSENLLGALKPFAQLYYDAVLRSRLEILEGKKATITEETFYNLPMEYFQNAYSEFIKHGGKFD